MWEKVKKALLFIGAGIIGFFAAVLFGRSFNGRGGSGASDRDSEIKDLQQQCNGKLSDIGTTASAIREDAREAGSHAERAESILQNAIDRSSKK